MILRSSLAIRYLTSNIKPSNEYICPYLTKPAARRWSSIHHQHRRTLTSNQSIEGGIRDFPVNTFTERTHTCGQLSRYDIGKRVNLFGWVQFSRFNNKIIALRDSYGVVQCIVEDRKKLSDILGEKSDIPNESVVQVSGIVKARPEGQENKSMSTGDVEVSVDKVQVLSQAKKDIPLLTREDPTSSSTTTSNRLKYRYLDLRSSSMQHALRFRSHVCKIIRNKLYDLNFVECETPTLFNRTPGGANEFIVPTQLKDKFYGLVQSPQQLKQLLMIGGLDRYFQICRCYRDETGRADRQPEFTQVDIELSFTNRDMIMKLIETLLYELLTNISDEPEVTKSLVSSFSGDDLEIEKITFNESFEKYGTDKPDTRFDWPIENDSDGGLFIDIPYNFSQEMFAEMVASLKAGKTDFTSVDIASELSHCGYLLKIKSLNRTDLARKILGALRVSIADELSRQGKKVYRSRFKFLWVVDFPLFTVDDQGKLVSNHHPFTAPTKDTIELLELEPMKVVGQHYDLVINGQEVAGGSIRIHDAELQRQIFTEILDVDENTFNYFIEALRSGCPPHGGIAIGLDRLVAILMDRSSIRDVIAFPKSTTGRDPMSDCPHEIGTDVKRLYHL